MVWTASAAAKLRREGRLGGAALSAASARRSRGNTSATAPQRRFNGTARHPVWFSAQVGMGTPYLKSRPRSGSVPVATGAGLALRGRHVQRRRLLLFVSAVCFTGMALGIVDTDLGWCHRLLFPDDRKYRFANDALIEVMLLLAGAQNFFQYTRGGAQWTRTRLLLRLVNVRHDSSFLLARRQQLHFSRLNLSGMLRAPLQRLSSDWFTASSVAAVNANGFASYS
jgi:hypothetical protein